MGEFDIKILADPEAFFENRLPAHSDHDYYVDEKNAEADEPDQKVLLNGVWKFNYSQTVDEAPLNFEKIEYDVTSWDEIKVPAHIQMEGYGHPAYVNTQYPWDGIEELEPGEVPKYFNPTGSYVRFFSLPDFMKEGPVYISFQGAESAIAVWLNGHYIGYSEDSFTPSEFDLTEYVDRDGVNKLAVRCFRFSSASWCEDQDFFRFSGIFRDVYLYTVPKVHVRDMKILTELDDNYEDADLKINFDIVTWGDAVPGKAVISLFDEEGNDAGTKEIFLADEKEAVIHVENPKKWSAEIPNLYDVEIRITNDAGEQTEFINENIGFRKFELKNSVMYLNGKRIVFFGVDRHEFSSETGRVVSDEDILKDILTMKRNNINAIRTSHYPNRTLLYRLCDIYGIYLIDETNLETHGVWDSIGRNIHQLDYSVPGDRPEFLEMIIDRARSMYERDKNHPSILIWSCGNESFGGTDLLKMSNEIRSWDPSRLVHYEGVWWDPRYPETTDMVSTMYQSVEDIKKFLSEHRDKPYISCEYAHAMGNSCGAIYKYTELTETEELYQG
ncbi:MAG: beta-galactosidase, partial [Lachnospiraceae bacterium]|nr:beta-galactosidase [Lachnospiraceae bacterium]